MDRIIVKVWLPQINQSFDMRIPATVTVGQVTEQLKLLFSKMRDVAFVPNEDTGLCEAETGSILDSNLLIAEAGIRNGSRLLLI